jgi:hypothetical protein
MGKLKERLTTTTSVELVGWRRVVQNYFTGTVAQSCTEEYIDDRYLTIQFQEVVYYPRVRDHWEEHYLCKDFNGLYWLLRHKYEAPVKR